MVFFADEEDAVLSGAFGGEEGFVGGLEQSLARCRVPSPVAVATSIFVVVVTVLIASAGHFYNFATSADASVLRQVFSIVTFTIPGVVVGGQIGPVVQARVNPDVTKVGIAFLFVAVGILMLTTVV